VQTLVAAEQQYDLFRVCVCSLRNPACNAHAPCFYLWLTRLYNVFPHYFMNGTVFGKKTNFIEHKICVFMVSTPFVVMVSTPFVVNISHYKKN